MRSSCSCAVFEAFFHSALMCAIVVTSAFGWLKHVYRIKLTTQLDDCIDQQLVKCWRIISAIFLCPMYCMHMNKWPLNTVTWLLHCLQQKFLPSFKSVCTAVSYRLMKLLLLMSYVALRPWPSALECSFHFTCSKVRMTFLSKIMALSFSSIMWSCDFWPCKI